jgi:hypothetical protein
MSGTNNRRRPFGGRNGKKLKNISQLMGPSTTARPITSGSNPARPTISQKFTHLPTAPGRHAKSSEVHVPRPPTPPVFPSRRSASPDRSDSDALVGNDPLVDTFDDYGDLHCCDEDDRSVDGGDAGMDAGDDEWDDVMMSAEDEDEKDTTEGGREKDKLAEVCYF